jgi:outer membrane protein
MPESRRAGLTRFSPSLRSAARGWSPRVASLGVLAGAVAVFASASPHAQTLTQALAETYNTNPQLLAQRALLRATDEQVPQALSFWRPTVNFTGQIGLATASLEAQPGPAAVAAGITRSIHRAITRPDSLTFQLTQPIYRGGRTEAQTRQAINTVESTRAQTLAVETTVFQAVAQAYLDVVRGLSQERRHAGKGGGDGEPCLDAHDAALRPPARRGQPR